MAVFYLRSTTGSDANDGTTWALAKATLAGAFAIASAGDTIYVSHAHAETQATSMVLTSPGTAAAPVNIICVNDGAEPPTTLATTATVTTTSNSSISFENYAYYYGITFSAGTGINAANVRWAQAGVSYAHYMHKCKLILGTTSTANEIGVGIATTGRARHITFDDTSVKFANTAQQVSVRSCRFIWKNTSAPLDATGSIPNTFIHPCASNGFPSNVLLHGVDFSALTSGKALINLGLSGPSVTHIRNCKLSTTASLTTSSITEIGSQNLYVDNCNSGNVHGHFEHYTYPGSVVRATGVYRSGGANNGSLGFSAKMVTLASGATFEFPLQCIQIPFYNSTTGSAITATVEIAQDAAAAALTESECWVEAEYMGTSGFPLSLFVNDNNSTSLTKSSTAQTTSSVTWVGLTTPTLQKLSVTFTPQAVGLVTLRVYLAKVNTTVYVDPLATVT